MQIVLSMLSCFRNGFLLYPMQRLPTGKLRIYAKIIL